MIDNSLYLVTPEIAQRSGTISGRYRIADGRFVLNNKDLERIRFTTDEYIHGLQGIEKVEKNYAKKLIENNGFSIGMSDDENTDNQIVTDERDTTETLIHSIKASDAIKSEISDSENQEEQEKLNEKRSITYRRNKK